jgi:hypothetical protein
LRRVLPLGLPALLIATLGLAAAVTHSSAHASGSTREPARAVAAKTLSLHLTVHSRPTTHKGNAVSEQGSFTGTLSGTLYAHYVAISGTEGTATVISYISGGGTLTSQARTHGHVLGATAYFSGTATITGGTGRWAHAHGTGLRFSGKMDRQNLHVTASLSGTLHT